jgi:hypothetical protein
MALMQMGAAEVIDRLCKILIIVSTNNAKEDAYSKLFIDTER